MAVPAWKMARRLKVKKKTLLQVGLIAVLVAAGLYFYSWLLGYQGGAGLLSRYPTFPPLQSTDRITIVSPHLDDETLGLGGFIKMATEQKIPVSVIFMTNGDDNPLGADIQFRTGYPTPQELIASGEARQKEALKALTDLGVNQSSIYFLGLPDRGLLTLHQPKYENIPYTSSGTLQNSSPYLNSYIPNLPYTASATRSALLQALQATRPTLVFTTLPDDYHTDHHATALFVQDIFSKMNSSTRLYYFLIHYPKYPRPKGVNSNAALLPPKNLENRPWEVIFLKPEQVDSKAKALHAYTSQLRIPFSGSLLLPAFVRQNELVTRH